MAGRHINPMDEGARRRIAEIKGRVLPVAAGATTPSDEICFDYREAGRDRCESRRVVRKGKVRGHA